MNNPSNVMWAQLILDNQATIEDVPAQLQAGVSEVVDYFTKTDSNANQTEIADKTDTTKPTDEPSGDTDKVATVDKSNENKTQSDADQAIDDANKAVEDATK